MFQTYCYNPKDADRLNLRKPQQACVRGNQVFEIFHNTYFNKNFDLEQLLQQLDIPTLIIHGDYDPIPLIAAEHTRASIPNSQLVVIKECGHFPFVEKPVTLFRTIQRFIRAE